jgi:hypothetical protein
MAEKVRQQWPALFFLSIFAHVQSSGITFTLNYFVAIIYTIWFVPLVRAFLFAKYDKIFSKGT